MKKMSAIFGSIAINLMLALAIVAVFSLTPAAEVVACTLQQAAAPAPADTHGRGGGAHRSHSYLVDVRMGWAAG
ncbi:MAG: hypothetical protein JO341_13870 [Gammaproteobacteria bacterium]|nr:hypothetical protein [Gammaproteobacteria bacterium]